MKKFYFFFLIPAFLVCFNFKLESRQYNIDYLMDLIEAGDEEGVKQFFSQPKYVTKLKHIVEFTEIFREKLEERFGYKPSYREAYDFFKDYVSNADFPKEQKKQLLAIFKEIVKQSEQAHKKGYKLDSITMDFKGSIESDIDLPDPIVIAYNEALGGALMCIIPSGFSQMVGGGMLIDAARRTYNYLGEKDSKKSEEYELRAYSDHGGVVEKDDYDRSRDHDHDSWDKAPDFFR